MTAAETYSCSSLAAGSYITEGLGEWEQSEQLVKAESTNYPTYNGAHWYFWCCRMGRGDLKSAEKLAIQYFALPQPHPDDTTFVVRGMYDVLQGNVQAARDGFQQALNIKRTFTYSCLVAQLSRDLKDEPAVAEVVAAMEKDIEDPAKNTNRPPDVIAAGKLLLDLVKNHNPSPEQRQRRRRGTAQDRQRPSKLCRRLVLLRRHRTRSGWQQEGSREILASRWIDPHRDQVLACLAGAKLTKLRGKSRPDDDPLAAEDMWPPLKAK